MKTTNRGTFNKRLPTAHIYRQKGKAIHRIEKHNTKKTKNMASSFYTVVIVFLVVALINTIAWFLAPKKGGNTTVFRSTFILALSMMYLMWAITYLAQLHPLVVPRRSDLRPVE